MRERERERERDEKRRGEREREAIFCHKRKNNNFDTYTVTILLAIATNILAQLKTGFVFQGHICNYANIFFNSPQNVNEQIWTGFII